jgi:hypothetical protein
MAIAQEQTKQKGPDLKALGLKSAAEIFDLLALLKIDGEPVIKEDQSLLDPREKARAVFEYFHHKFDLEPENLPYLASLIKRDLQNGKLNWRRG